MTVLVVGIDFSKPSKSALDAAATLAKGLGASLVLVHATATLPLGSKRGHLDPISQVKVEVEAHDVAQASATWVKRAGKKVKTEFVSKRGSPAEVILATAKARKALYIVVGSHGRTGIKRAVMGSVAEAVVRESKIPVLVVPA